MLHPKQDSTVNKNVSLKAHGLASQLRNCCEPNERQPRQGEFLDCATTTVEQGSAVPANWSVP
jgi:hypothetical protein